MNLQHVSLGERIVMASRLLAAEQLRQEADEQGINVKRLQNQMLVIRMSEQAAAEANLRQDLYRQPTALPVETKEAA